jgi:hypothetical protein
VPADDRRRLASVAGDGRLLSAAARALRPVHWQGHYGSCVVACVSTVLTGVVVCAVLAGVHARRRRRAAGLAVRSAALAVALAAPVCGLGAAAGALPRRRRRRGSGVLNVLLCKVLVLSLCFCLVSLARVIVFV